MTGEARISFSGSLTADPDVRSVGDGTVASFSVAVNGRKYNRDTNEYDDKPATFFRCSAWRALGDNTANSLHKGDRVVVSGTIEEREWEDKEGNQRTSMDVTVEEIGASLQFATVSVQRAVKNGNQQQRGQQRNAQRGGGQQRQQRPQPVAQDDWATPGTYDDETPF
jgi:single-strand DNA-binding protein